MRKLKKLNLSEREVNRLITIINSEKNDYKTNISTYVIYLYNQNKSIEEIIKETDLSERTIWNYLKKYKEDPYFMHKFKNRTSNLEDFTKIIIEYLEEHKISSLKEASKQIEKLTGLKRCEERILNFFTKSNITKKNGRYSWDKYNEITNIDIRNNKKEIILFIDKNNSEDINILVNRIKNHFPNIVATDKEIKDFILFSYRL